MYYFFEILGTIAFAASGAMVAVERKMDILGVAILGVTTATGGGIIRDVLIGITPPTGLTHPEYALISIAVSLIIFIPAIRKKVDLSSPVIILIDAIGLGIFTVTGCRVARPYGNLWLQLFMGVLTGVGGGVTRDIFAARKPVIFVKHFYAAASLAGAVVFSVFDPFAENFSLIIATAVVVVLRMLAAKYKWHLPKA